MKFDFKINKYYLVSYAMTSKYKPFSGWEKLEDKIWEKHKYEPAYYFLNSKYINWAIEKLQTDFSDENIKDVFLKQASILEKIYQEIFKTKEFKRLYKETERHLKLVENQWQKNEKEVLKILKEVSGLPTPKHKINVYITHPKLHIGRTLDKKTIVWGHEEDWTNYSSVYLCHELLHIMTWPGHFQPNFDILHAIVVLADDELKIRLNRKGKYLSFKKEELNTEAVKLINLAKRIMPYWKKYLNGKLGKNILELKNLLDKYKKRGAF
ncbi:MAG: hypothetical protein NTV77_00615 [Candidatus Azambacteria bacterium]|nr:hypothetical protein [Candidatus Azambacteria bacterium]